MKRFEKMVFSGFGSLALVVHCLLAGIVDAADKPNVLVIMADDLGFSDLGCYGSEIETPHLDRLADGGLRFSQFYNTAKCHSSRVSLLSGQYCIAAGDTNLTHAVTSAEVLRDGGYFTAMTGKWHLKEQPTNFGFERYFGHLSGACNYFRGDKTFRLNGEPWQVPSEDFYTTVANVDYGLDFLEEARDSNKPWYLYVAFNAPHAPLQALADDYEKYEGRYAVGWDTIRASRLEKQRKLGLLPADCVASPRPDHIPAWDDMSDARKRFEEKRMTTLAAMIDRVDQEIGRLIRYLNMTDQLDNTLIVFVSDNGACPYDRRAVKIDAIPTDGSVIWSDSTAWAWVRNSPFRFYKQNQFEGGICTPAIAHWPNGIKADRGSISRQPAHLIDVMPTLADITGSTIPTTYVERTLRPVSGQSLRPIFDGETLQREAPLHFQFASDRGLRIGDWKLVSFRNGPWELYNIASDRTELNELSRQEPARLKSMAETWNAMARDVLHTSREFVAPNAAGKISHQHPEWTNFSQDPVDGRKGNQKRQDNAESPAKRGTSVQRKGQGGIRARKNTTMEIAGDEIRLTFTGEDPGIAIDNVPPNLNAIGNVPPNLNAFDKVPSNLKSGPYKLAFELKSKGNGDGDVHFTTDAETSLPRGKTVSFPTPQDGTWKQHVIVLDTTKRIHKLRLDVSDGAGTATIQSLRLLDSNGNVLMQWPRQITKQNQ